MGTIPVLTRRFPLKKIIHRPLYSLALIISSFVISVSLGARTVSNSDVLVPTGQVFNEPLRVYLMGDLINEQPPTLALVPSKDDWDNGKPMIYVEPSITLSGQMVSIADDNGDGSNPAPRLAKTVIYDLPAMADGEFKFWKWDITLLTGRTFYGFLCFPPQAQGTGSQIQGQNPPSTKVIAPEMEAFQSACEGQGVVIDSFYLGNAFNSGMYSFLVLLIVSSAVLYLALREGGLIFVNGIPSLSRLQVILWTIVISFLSIKMVLQDLIFPDYSEKLIVLLGLSLVTLGFGNLPDKTKPDVNPTGAPPTPDKNGGGDPSKASPGTDSTATSTVTNPPSQKNASIFDILIDPDSLKKGQRQVSVTRAQMFFWTIISVFLFVFMSLTEGKLWDIPWSLIALMGISQASYFVPKAYNRFSAPNK